MFWRILIFGPILKVKPVSYYQRDTELFKFIGRFILCDEDDGLYEAMDIDPYDPEADEKREELKQKRQKKLLSQVDFDK